MRDRHYDDPPLDPQVEAELTELDAALAGSSDADPTLRALVADVQAERPVPDEAFLGRLDEHMDATFQRDRKRAVASETERSRRRRRPALRFALPALATACAAVIAGVIVIDQQSGPDGSGGGSDQAAVSRSTATTPAPSGAAPPQTESEAPPAGGGTTGSDRGTGDDSAAPSRSGSVVPAPSPAPPESGSKDRKVERSASITIRVKPSKIQETADRATRIVEVSDGWVDNAAVTVRGDGGYARLRLRVKTDRLREVMADLSRIGRVSERQQSETDITGTFDAAKTELEEARAERRGLLSALGKAKSGGQIARLKTRLRDNRERLQRADAAMTGVRSRTARATVELSIYPEYKGASSSNDDDDSAWGIADAAKTALQVLSASAGALLIGLVAVIPLLALTLIGLLAVRTARRRSRERALDQAPRDDPSSPPGRDST